MRRNARMSCSGSRPSCVPADADWVTGEVVATDGESPSTSLIEKRGESGVKGWGFRVEAIGAPESRGNGPHFHSLIMEIPGILFGHGEVRSEEHTSELQSLRHIVC